MVMCFVGGDLIVGVLYGRGSFSTEAISRTNGVVIGYAAGFFSKRREQLSLRFIMLSRYKTPMINGAISVGVNVALSITLSKFLGVTGIALATSISMLVVTALLLPGVKNTLQVFP